MGAAMTDRMEASYARNDGPARVRTMDAALAVTCHVTRVRVRRFLSIVLVASLLLTSACDAGDATEADAGAPLDVASSIDVGSAVDAPPDFDAPRQPVVRGTRYCEILLAFLESGAIRAEVWGTQGLNDCPAAAWDAIDVGVVRAATGASFVARNGPRYWLPDRTSADIPDRPPAFFGELLMQQLASIMLPPGTTASVPYTERTILRDSVLEFDAGREVYELLAPDGSIYVMQSYAQIVDTSLAESDLPTLGATLALPTGWSYRARTLDTVLVVSTPGMATVLQDELQNSYSLHIDGG